ncbi:outer membrane lipoprotein-sorting protein [Henriciella sp. AS95]|uniref:outer membrane lipoprotein-sorting protein n=1 Tax=Henriciella sp. AS95 TaxID=3135782 RepID=UPI00316FADDB
MLSRNAIALCLVWLTPGLAGAQEPINANDLAKLVAERAANEGRVGTMHFRLENSSSRVREREALMIHSEKDDTERIAIYFTEPAMIEDTAFLSFNHAAAEDENWLYLPATDRVRRLPASDRGDYFLGTDLTYGDIKDNFKFGLDDWDFAIEAHDAENGSLPILTGQARTPEIGAEMGYGSFRAGIDLETAFPVWIDYTDTDGEPLKRVEVLEIEIIGGVHTALAFTATNQQTGHSTAVSFTGMHHVPQLDQSIFDPETLAYGIPDVDG